MTARFRLDSGYFESSTIKRAVIDRPYKKTEAFTLHAIISVRIQPAGLQKMNRHFTRKIMSLGAVLHVLCAMVWAFPQSGEAPLRQIVLASEQEAKEVRASLSAGASFEALAAERSRDVSGQRGGYLGRMRLSDLRSEVRKALEPIAPGKVTDPVRVGNAYILFQVVPEAEARWIDLDEAGAQALAEGRKAEAGRRRREVPSSAFRPRPMPPAVMGSDS